MKHPRCRASDSREMIGGNHHCNIDIRADEEGLCCEGSCTHAEATYHVVLDESLEVAKDSDFISEIISRPPADAAFGINRSVSPFLGVAPCVVR